MIVYKFGGASVKDAPAVRNLAKIVASADEPLVVVVSAMGKTTNRLEAVVEEAVKNTGLERQLLENLKNDHLSIIAKLFNNASHPVFGLVRDLFDIAAKFLKVLPESDYNFLYDQVVSIGELVSTKIVSAWLDHEEIDNQWIDIRRILKTNSIYREAKVNHDVSASPCPEFFKNDKGRIYVTQGFIGSDDKGNTTTLGREGSDYTAALLASYLNAKNVTLWKDVDGIYNADPAVFQKVEKIEKLDYQEVIELTYYGAKVIHPKTLKPLYERKIPLFVKSFNAPQNAGTAVKASGFIKRDLPYIILLENQVLITISKKNLSFISELNLSFLFDLLHGFRLKANLMQHSAISFSFCVDIPKGKTLDDLYSNLSKEFYVRYNAGLSLITIRNYNVTAIHELTKGKKILVEQRSRSTVQFVMA